MATSRVSAVVPVSDMTNYFAAARRAFRRLLLERLRSVCAGRPRIRGRGAPLAPGRLAVTWLPMPRSNASATWPTFRRSRRPIRDSSRPLARGGMGTVYRGRDSRARSDVADQGAVGRHRIDRSAAVADAAGSACARQARASRNRSDLRSSVCSKTAGSST